MKTKNVVLLPTNRFITKQNNMKKEIIKLFNTLKNNTDENIAKELNIPAKVVCKTLKDYLKEKAECIGEKFYIFESKMNNQEKCTIED